MSQSISLADLTADHFEPLVGQGFRVRHPEHEETLTLERLERKNAPIMGRIPFSLFFRGESQTVLLNQHIHPMDQESLGQLEIFLVPIGRNPDGTHEYQAVFS